MGDEEGEIWGLAEKVDSLVCPAFSLSFNSLSLVFLLLLFGGRATGWRFDHQFTFETFESR